MSAIPVGNQLYIYALLSREIGVSRQTMLSRVEEVLLAHDVWPSDLGCTDTRELMDKLDGFIRVAVFKKGRVYVTVIQQPEWDDALEQLQKESLCDTPKKKSDTNTPRAWKRKRGKKELKPVKPRPKGRPKPEPEEEPEQGHEEDSVPETASKQDAQAETVDSAIDREAGNAAPVAQETADGALPDVASAAETVEREVEPAATSKQTFQPTTSNKDVETTSDAAESVNAKKDAESPRDEDQQTNASAKPHQPTESAESIVDTPTPEAASELAQALEEDPARIVEPAVPSASAEADAPVATLAAEPVQTSTQAPGPEPMPEISPEQTPASEPAPATTAPSAPTSAPATSRPTPAPRPAIPTQSRYPHSFVSEVLLPNEPLSALYQVLPLHVDPMLLLEEDWRVSRSTRTFRTEGPLVTFPLRYVRETTHKPVEVSMRRVTSTPSGKIWRVESITGEPDVSFDGLPVEGTAAFRELAQFATLGSWQALVRNLKRACGKGGLPFTADELRTYLPYTFHRIRLEDKFVTYTRKDDERGASVEGRPLCGAFNTGLISDDHQTILMCFEAQDGDIPWRFTCFQKAQFVKLDGPEPLSATYVRSLSDIAIFAETPVQPSKKLAEAYGPEALEAMQAALRHAQRDYRLATPAYDPVENVLRILLPVCLDDAQKPSHALVLCPVEDGEGFVATSVLPLSRAAVCARVVSFELPQWLLA